MTNNILVTGCLGFIGSWFIKLLVDTTNYDITVIDNNTYAADISRLKEIEDEIDFLNKIYIGDICDNDLCNEIIEDNDIDTIVNFAAETMVDRSINNSKEFVYSNFVGVQTLLEICRQNNEKKRNDIRFIQISTDEVYGSIDKGSFNEEDRLRPGNPYSACKAAADLLCLAYCNTHKVPIIITRSSNNYGPYQHQEKFIPKMIIDAIQGKPLSIYGNGKNIRDWLYVEDNAKGILRVMENGKIGKIYNIGGGDELTNNYVASIIAKRFGVEIKYIEDRKGHDKRYSINCDKIKNELGWKPVKKFEDGIEDTINWYIEEEKNI